MRTFNEVFTKLTMRRRYEVWFLRVGLGDGSGVLAGRWRSGVLGKAHGWDPVLDQKGEVWGDEAPRFQAYQAFLIERKVLVAKIRVESRSLSDHDVFGRRAFPPMPGAGLPRGSFPGGNPARRYSVIQGGSDQDFETGSPRLR